MRAHHQVAGVVGGQEIGAGFGVGVVSVELTLPAERPLQKAALPGRFVERQRRPDHGGVVGGEPRQQQLALAPGMAEAAVPRHVHCNKIEGPARHVQPGWLIEEQPGLDQARNHQPVPVRQHLVVQTGPDSFLAFFQ